MNYKQYVLDNQKIISAIKDNLPGDDFLDKLFGTLDMACARFNTILLKLIQEPLKADEYDSWAIKIDETTWVRQPTYIETLRALLKCLRPQSALAGKRGRER